MEFSPANNIVKLCIQGIGMKEKGEPAEAERLFRQAWNEATNSFEQFLAAYYVARSQQNINERLKWFETALASALETQDAALAGIFPPLYSAIAQCHEELGQTAEAQKNRKLAQSFQNKITDKGPFYHGTKASLQPGDLLTPGGESNYQPGLKMNHIYFTALVNGAGLAASLAKSDGAERVYLVEPTGSFEDDPNVTNKKFPGNLTRSYRSASPLKIIGEVPGWVRQTPGQLEEWRKKLDDNKGEIIN